MKPARMVALVAVGVLVATSAGACGSSTPYRDISRGPKLGGSEQGVRSDHWHAAIGVNVCGAWQPGPIWRRVHQSAPARHDDPGVYAGLHTHLLSNGQPDGVVHIEPNQRDETGRNATLGRFLEFGGWRANADALELWQGESGRPIEVGEGQKCGPSPAVVRWATGNYVAGEATRLTEQHGDPSRLRLRDNQVIALYFLPSTTLLGTLGEVPSISNLPDGQGVAATTTTAPRS